jgi:hypothetical protein
MEWRDEKTVVQCERKHQEAVYINHRVLVFVLFKGGPCDSQTYREVTIKLAQRTNLKELGREETSGLIYIIIQVGEPL